MPNVICTQCESCFYVKPSHQKLGWGKYCSINCRTIAQRKGHEVNCYICNKEIYRSLKELSKSKSKKYFCGKKCQTVWRNTVLFTGDNHPNWVSGESSYRKRLLASGRLEVCTLCTNKDKRVLMVHHIDRNRKNNNMDNLAWLCNNCHYLVHHYQDERAKLESLLNK